MRILPSPWVRVSRERIIRIIHHEIKAAVKALLVLVVGFDCCGGRGVYNSVFLLGVIVSVLVLLLSDVVLFLDFCNLLLFYINFRILSLDALFHLDIGIKILNHLQIFGQLIILQPQTILLPMILHKHPQHSNLPINVPIEIKPILLRQPQLRIIIIQ